MGVLRGSVGALLVGYAGSGLALDGARAERAKSLPVPMTKAQLQAAIKARMQWVTVSRGLITKASSRRRPGERRERPYTTEERSEY
jgi:hypothetical protein